MSGVGAHHEMARSRFKIVIVEDHILFAESLELALTVEGYDVRRITLPERGGGQSTRQSIIRAKPRVVLLDLDLGVAGDGIRWIKPLASAGINVVVVTSSIQRSRWGEAIWHGARTVLSKNRPLNDILAVVRRLNQGLPVSDAQEREELLATWRAESETQRELRGRLEQLTARESEVLGHLMRGRTVSDIAALSVVSQATVRTQVKAILAKLQVSSQLAAVGMAHRVGWSAVRTEEPQL